MVAPDFLACSVTTHAAQKHKVKSAGSQKTTRAHIELELIQNQMTQKYMLRIEVGMRVRCANKARTE